MSKAQHVRAQRIYQAPSPQDGQRILVDRLWPRGISKQAANLDEWAKAVAPGTRGRPAQEGRLQAQSGSDIPDLHRRGAVTVGRRQLPSLEVAGGEEGVQAGCLSCWPGTSRRPHAQDR